MGSTFTLVMLALLSLVPSLVTAALVMLGIWWMQRRAASTPRRTTAERLDELDALLAQGRISHDEHRVQREAVIGAI